VAQGGPMGGGPMMSSPPPKATKAAPKKKPAARGFLPGKTAKKGPGQCGTYMFWKGGKCVDARAPSK
jgi:hypothetical protein